MTRVRATGRGHWPGTDPLTVMQGIVADLSGEAHPFLPVMPERGPGAELTGYASALLVDLDAELRPHGWQIIDSAGRDARRGAAAIVQDRDAAAEAAHGRTGPLMLTLPGPWSLAALLYGPGGERMIADAGGRRDLIDSYAEGAAEHVRRLAALLPGAELQVRLEEPELVRCLSGRLRAASGFKAIAPVPEQEAVQRLRGFAAALRDAGAVSVIVQLPGRSPLDWDIGEGPRPLLPLLRQSGIEEIGVPFSALTVRDWEVLAAGFESGLRFWLGLTSSPASVRAAVDRLLGPWRRLGMPQADAAAIGVQIGHPPALTGAEALELAGRPSQPRADIEAALHLAEAVLEESRV